MHLSAECGDSLEDFLLFLEMNLCVGEAVMRALGATDCVVKRGGPTEHRCNRCNKMYFNANETRGGASLKSHWTRSVKNGGCTGTPPLDGSAITSRKVKVKKLKELEDLQPKVKIDPDCWVGVSLEDMRLEDQMGLLELQNEYEFKYLGAWIRSDGDTMHEVRCRVESALRTFWDMRKIWRDSSMSRGDKLRLYKAAVVSTATYGCEAWRLTEQVVKHLRYMNGKCLAQIFEMEVQDCIAKPPWDLVGSVRLRRINWLGGVLRRPDTDIVKRVTVSFVETVLRQRRTDTAMREETEATPPRRRSRRVGRPQPGSPAIIAARVPVKVRKANVGAIILDAALPKFERSEELLAVAADEKAWSLITKSLEESINTETPTKPQIDQMRTRRQVRQIADKGGTYRALQQMKIGEFAVFTDGSFTKAGYHKTIKCPISGDPLWMDAKAGWGAQIVQKGKNIHPHRLGTVAGSTVARLCGRVIMDISALDGSSNNITDPPHSTTHPCYLGAQCLSNNTAELSGVAQALLWLRAEGGTDAAHIFYDSDYAAGIARGRYKSNTNAEIAKRVQKLAREENARRSTGGRDGIVWRHVKGHAGHPGNEWADRLADLGADCQFDRYVDGAKEFNDVAYPLVADPYEESATADIRNATIPSLETVLASGLCPDGETRFRSPRDCVIWGDTSKWANLRLVAADKIKTTARTINFDPAGL